MMEIEIRALLDHAAYCRKVAAETAHRHAARRLVDMASEFERRAGALASDLHMSK